MLHSSLPTLESFIANELVYETMNLHRLKEINGIAEDLLKLPQQDWESYLDQHYPDDPVLRQEASRFALDLQSLSSPTITLQPRPMPNVPGFSAESYQSIRLIRDDGSIRLYEAFGTGGESGRKFLLREFTTAKIDLRHFSLSRLNLEYAPVLNSEGIIKITKLDSSSDGHLYYAAVHPGDFDGLENYCRSANLALRQRLQLFEKICSIVLLAHQCQSVHGGLRPDNILIASEGKPHLLDFGLVDVLYPRADPLWLVGGWSSRERVKAVQYMSPEQVQGRSISEKSDIYSLGALLYMLCTDQLPYAANGIVELLHMIAVEDPARPGSAASRPWTLQNGSREPIPPDLDRIILTAMRKVPYHRFSIEELLAEIRAFGE